MKAIQIIAERQMALIDLPEEQPAREQPRPKMKRKA